MTVDQPVRPTVLVCAMTVKSATDWAEDSGLTTGQIVVASSVGVVERTDLTEFTVVVLRNFWWHPAALDIADAILVAADRAGITVPALDPHHRARRSA